MASRITGQGKILANVSRSDMVTFNTWFEIRDILNENRFSLKDAPGHLKVIKSKLNRLSSIIMHEKGKGL